MHRLRFLSIYRWQFFHTCSWLLNFLWNELETRWTLGPPPSNSVSARWAMLNRSGLNFKSCDPYPKKFLDLPLESISVAERVVLGGGAAALLPQKQAWKRFLSFLYFLAESYISYIFLILSIFSYIFLYFFTFWGKSFFIGRIFLKGAFCQLFDLYQCSSHLLQWRSRWNMRQANRSKRTNVSGRYSSRIVKIGDRTVVGEVDA